MTVRTAFIASISLLALNAVARAEIGSPVGPGKGYGSVESGYHNSDGAQTSTPSQSEVNNGTPVGGGGGSASASGAASASVNASAGPASGAGTSLGIGAGAQVGAAGASGSESALASTELPLNGGNIDAEEGMFGGLTLGYVPVAPLLGFINRLEYYGSVNHADDEDTGKGCTGARI